MKKTLREKWLVWNPPGEHPAYHEYDNEAEALAYGRSIKDKHPKKSPPICEKMTIEEVEL